MNFKIIFLITLLFLIIPSNARNYTESEISTIQKYDLDKNGEIDSKEFHDAQLDLYINFNLSDSDFAVVESAKEGYPIPVELQFYTVVAIIIFVFGFLLVIKHTIIKDLKTKT